MKSLYCKNNVMVLGKIKKTKVVTSTKGKLSKYLKGKKYNIALVVFRIRNRLGLISLNFPQDKKSQDGVC